MTRTTCWPDEQKTRPLHSNGLWTRASEMPFGLWTRTHCVSVNVVFVTLADRSRCFCLCYVCVLVSLAFAVRCSLFAVCRSPFVVVVDKSP